MEQTREDVLLVRDRARMDIAACRDDIRKYGIRIDNVAAAMADDRESIRLIDVTWRLREAYLGSGSRARTDEERSRRSKLDGRLLDDSRRMSELQASVDDAKSRISRLEGFVKYLDERLGYEYGGGNDQAK